MTNELKEKLLAYGTKAEPFTVHNHIRVTDLQDGEARVELTLQPESLNRWGTAHGGFWPWYPCWQCISPCGRCRG